MPPKKGTKRKGGNANDDTATPTQPKGNKIHHTAKHTAKDVAAKEAGAVSLDEWVSARKLILNKEKDLIRQWDAMLAERRALPWTKLTTDYVFQNESGNDVKLSELFTNGTPNLVIYHLSK